MTGRRRWRWWAAVVVVALATSAGAVAGRRELRAAARAVASGSRASAAAVAGSAPAVPAAEPPWSAGDAMPAVTATAGPYRVVGLGDSVPAGTACSCTPYVQLVGDAQAQRTARPASVDNLAVPGLTTAQLLDQLQQSDVAATVAQADLVIVTIGANDFDPSQAYDAGCAPPALVCYQSDLTAQVTQLDDVLATIASLAGDARVLVTGYWNVFLDGEVGQEQGASYVAASDALTLADNAVIAAASSRHADTYVDLYAPFKGDGSADDTALLAADGDHPDAAGHALIASTLEAALG